jgi:hypothetical protein
VLIETSGGLDISPPDQRAGQDPRHQMHPEVAKSSVIDGRTSTASRRVTR